MKTVSMGFAGFDGARRWASGEAVGVADVTRSLVSRFLSGFPTGRLIAACAPVGGLERRPSVIGPTDDACGFAGAAGF